MKNRQLYSPGWLDTVRPAILKRDNYKCMHCGIRHRTIVYTDLHGNKHECDQWLAEWARNKGYKVQVIYIQVAHLDQNPGNDNPDNLRSLCPSCHLSYDNRFNAVKRLARRSETGNTNLVERANAAPLLIGSSYRPELKPSNLKNPL